MTNKRKRFKRWVEKKSSSKKINTKQRKFSLFDTFLSFNFNFIIIFSYI